MWHRLTLSIEEAAEGEEKRILETVSYAVLRNRQAICDRIAMLRQAGNLGVIPLQETPVEIDSLWDEGRVVLHLNDAALNLYRANGGTRRAESSVAELPYGRRPSLMRNTLFTIP